MVPPYRPHEKWIVAGAPDRARQAVDVYFCAAVEIRGGDNGDTILTIEESGFVGSSEAIVARVLDSTGGFNQVVVAAKAFIEHGIGLNVVASHA